MAILEFDILGSCTLKISTLIFFFFILGFLSYWVGVSLLLLLSMFFLSNEQFHTHLQHKSK